MNGTDILGSITSITKEVGESLPQTVWFPFSIFLLLLLAGSLICSNQKGKKLKRLQAMSGSGGKELSMSLNDVYNLYDFFYISKDLPRFESNLKKVLKLNNLYEWYKEFFGRMNKIVFPELCNIKEIGSNVKSEGEGK